MRSSPALHLVHRHVGLVQQLFGVVTLVRKRDADAGREIDSDSPEAERERQSIKQPRGDALHQRLVVEFMTHDDELVTREARQRVTRPKHGLDARTDSDQELVPGLVPGTVVHPLEIVQVDEKHRHRLARTTTTEKRMLESLEQQRTIRQPGQRIME